jgi:malate dehydrogenase (oxaloacetate-decarboxylating)
VKVPEVFQVETPRALGSLASVLNAITETGIVLEHLSVLRSDPDRTLWEITVEIDESAQAELLGRLNALPAVRFVGVVDRRRGGKIEMHSRLAISTQQILRDIDTPGVARICLAIHAALPGKLLPDPPDMRVPERVSGAVQTAINGAAHGSVPTDSQRAEDPPEVSGPQSGVP